MGNPRLVSDMRHRQVYPPRACAIFVTLCAAIFWYLSGFVDYLLHGAEDWHFIYMDTIQDKGLYFAHLWFQFWKSKSVIPESMESMTDTASVGIGFVLMLGLCLFIALWFGNHLEQEHDLSSLTKFVFICAVVTMAMSLNIFPWNQLQMASLLMYKLIGAIRFPHRFLGWGALFAVEIFGYCLWLFKRLQRQVYEVIFGVGIVGLLTGGIYLLNYIAG